MGLPIPDGPPIGSTDSEGFGIDIEPSLPVIALCGFKLPLFRYALKYKLPPLAFPPQIPFPLLSLGLLCSLNNPLDFSFGIPPGGGRTPRAPKDPDSDFD